MSRRLVVLLILVAVGLTGPVTSAWAHPPTLSPATLALAETTESLAPAASMLPTGEWRAAPSPLPPPWLALVSGIIGLVAICYRPRRAIAIGIVCVLALFAFEYGVHSVHHLDDPGAGAVCAVASATGQLAGMLVDAPVVSPVAPPQLHSGLPDSSPKLAAGCGSAHQGRAPPLSA